MPRGRFLLDEHLNSMIRVGAEVGSSPSIRAYKATLADLGIVERTEMGWRWVGATAAEGAP